jgi:hypothetical protein
MCSVIAASSKTCWQESWKESGPFAEKKNDISWHGIGLELLPNLQQISSRAALNGGVKDRGEKHYHVIFMEIVTLFQAFASLFRACSLSNNLLCSQKQGLPSKGGERRAQSLGLHQFA